MAGWQDAPPVEEMAASAEKPKWATAPAAVVVEPSIPDPTIADAVAHNLSQGVTFGTSDEIVAALRSGAGLWGDYGKALADERANLDRARERHPIASIVSELAGGLTGGVGAAKSGATLLKPGMKLGKAIGLGALEGAGWGGLYGFGTGEGGAENRLENAGVGVGTGAIVGAAAPVVARGVGKAAKAIKERFGTSAGQRLLLDDLAAEGLTPKRIQSRAGRLGPEGMLADTSETMRLRAEQIAQSDNKARASVINALNARNIESKERIASAFDDVLGSTPNVRKILEEATESTKKLADELYGAARKIAKPVNTSKLIENIDNALYTDAETAVQARSSPTPDALDNEMKWLMGRLTGGGNKQGTAGVTQLTDFNKLHTLQRDLGDKARAYARKGDNYVAARLFKARGQLLSALDEATISNPADPESSLYKAARRQFSDDKAVEEAFEMGRDIFSAKTHPDFLAADVAKMASAEKDAVQLGVRAAVDEAMGRVKNGALKGRDLLNANFNERKMGVVLGPERAQKLVDALLSEQAMAATKNQALGNSATARRMMDNPFKASKETPEPSISKAVGKVWKVGTQAFRDKRAEGLAEQVAPMLTAKGAARDEVVRNLIEADLKRVGAKTKPETVELLRSMIFGAGQSGGNLLSRP